MKINKKNTYYLTSNFYLAVYLYLKGLQLTNIDWSNPRRAHFVFIDTPQREFFVKQFIFGEKNSPDVMVDSREFEMATKILKNKLYQEIGKKTDVTG